MKCPENIFDKIEYYRLNKLQTHACVKLVYLLIKQTHLPTMHQLLFLKQLS
jgi:hypothetical protein